MIKAAANSGHNLANIADDYEEREDWQNAIVAHDKAAVEFESALKDATDMNARNTLQLLIKTHLRKSKELQRKVDRISASRPKAVDLTSDDAFDMRRLEQEIHAMQKGELQPPMGESYAILANEEEDAEDPFNKFWGVVEPMMDKLSNPAAFTSAPVHENDVPIPINMQNRAAVDEQESIRIEREMSSIIESFFGHPPDDVQQDEEDAYGSRKNGSAATELTMDYKQENEELRAQLLQLTSQIHSLEKKTIDSTVLKSSILQFKNDIHKQALRILQSQETSIMTRSATTTGSPLSKNIRTMGTSTAEIVNRIKELEEDNQNLRSQNRKQEALMNKYRERWEKLKEGAKKRHHHHHHHNNNANNASSPPPLHTRQKN